MFFGLYDWKYIFYIINCPWQLFNYILTLIKSRIKKNITPFRKKFPFREKSPFRCSDTPVGDPFLWLYFQHENEEIILSHIFKSLKEELIINCCWTWVVLRWLSQCKSTPSSFRQNTFNGEPSAGNFHGAYNCYCYSIAFVYV